jgi:hypothetical protein
MESQKSRLGEVVAILKDDATKQTASAVIDGLTYHPGWLEQLLETPQQRDRRIRAESVRVVIRAATYHLPRIVKAGIDNWKAVFEKGEGQ